LAREIFIPFSVGGGIRTLDDMRSVLLAGAENIRDVIAFPKTTSASCLMTGAPSDIPRELLDELGVKLAKKVEKDVRS